MFRHSLMLAMVIVLCLPESVSAIVTSDEAGSHQTSPGERSFEVNVDGVVLVAGDVPEPTSLQDLIPFCTGALISDRHILSAAHCFDENEGGRIDDYFHMWPHVIAFELVDGIVRINFSHDDVFLPPNWHGDPDAGFRDWTDIAIVELPEDAPSEVPRYALYGATDEIGKPFVIVGYGDRGHGSTGETESDPVKRAGLNRFVELYYSDTLAYDFDSGREENNALALSGFESDLGFGNDEVFMGSGDSGGPAFIDGAIAGINSWISRLPSADVTGIIDSSWGEGGFSTRVSRFVELLREATNGTAVFVGIPGDFNTNGILDGGDVDLLAAEIRSSSGDMNYDLNGDNEFTSEDHVSWVHELAVTWFGDANLNGEFNSSDLVAVFAAGKYERDVVARWSKGDWDGDGRFGTGDLVAAFEDGGYEQGPRMAVNAVPEPASVLILTGGLIGVAFCHRRSGCARWRNSSPGQSAVSAEVG